MTDQQLAEFLGIAGKKGEAEIIAKITPAHRALYERMATLEAEVAAWRAGTGPKPTGVIICERRRR